MTTRVEVVGDRGVDQKEALGRSERPETLHLPFSLPDRDVRALDPIVLPPRPMTPHREAEIPHGGGIGPQLIGHDRSRREALLFQQRPHQFKCCMLIPSGLDEDIKHLTILIDCAPQIHPLSADGDEHLVQMPLRMCPRSETLELSRVGGAEPRYPAADRLIGDLDPTLGQEILGITQTQRKFVTTPWKRRKRCCSSTPVLAYQEFIN
jgi:hypothetical protein